METNPRSCPLCTKPIRGRADKKFCGDECRTAYYNEQNGELNNLIRNVNFILRKNRKILSGILQDSKSVVCARSALNQLGFDFRYHTHEQIRKNGSSLQFCYDIGYTCLDESRIRIVPRSSGRRQRLPLP